MEILFYQAFIVFTIVFVRIFSKKSVGIACFIWTALTLFNLFWPPLIVLQLIVVWGTYSLVRPKYPDTRSDGLRQPSANPIETEKKQSPGQRKISPPRSYIAEVPKAQARAGDVSRGLDAERRVEDAGARDHALFLAAEAQAKAGDVSGALETARSIEDTSWRARALYFAAKAQAHAGDVSGALETARSIEDAEDRDWVFFSVAEAQAEAGDASGALETARSIEDAEARDSALFFAAKAQAVAGDASGALETARRIEDTSWRARDHALSLAATAQAEAGDVSGALETARRIKGAGGNRDHALSLAAKAQAEAGDVSGALETARSIEDTFWRARAFSSAAKAQAKAGDVSGALDTAPSVADLDSLRLASILKSRGIEHLVHFTQAHNLASIFREGLISTAEANRRGINVRTNDADRYDGYLNAISLSVSFPNAPMFYKQRKLRPEADWVILLIDPQVLSDKRCGYCRFNAADKRVPKRNEGALLGADRFSEMFDRSIASKDLNLLRACDPTDPQAEVLVFEKIEQKWIRRVVFFDEEVLRCYEDVIQCTNASVDQSWLSSRSFLLSSQKKRLQII